MSTAVSRNLIALLPELTFDWLDVFSLVFLSAAGFRTDQVDILIYNLWRNFNKINLFYVRFITIFRAILLILSRLDSVLVILKKEDYFLEFE